MIEDVLLLPLFSLVCTKSRKTQRSGRLSELLVPVNLVVMYLIMIENKANYY
jgi:hypothetical protein